MMARYSLAGVHAAGRLPRRPIIRMYSSMECRRPLGAALTNSENTDPSVGVKRLSRKRYSAANTRGRSKHIYDIITSLKSVTKEEATASFERLHPRDKLDVMRALNRRCGRRSCNLPTYRSHLFEKYFYFKEEDLCEQSTLGRGPGGQATNRRMQTAIIKHIPTGIVVKFSKFPSYWLNRRAAREILNLRLEEHILGSKSRLGHIKECQEKRRLRQLRVTQRLVEKGNIIAAKVSQQHEFHAVLTGASPFPSVVLMQLGPSYSGHALFISDLFEGECSRWWEMLSSAFLRMNTNNCNDNPTLPELFLYVFPAVYFSLQPPTCVEKYEWGEIQKCSNDEAALRNVMCGLRCFVELFGLRMHEKCLTACGGEKRSVLLLEPDGLNWVEHKGRMVASTAKMTPLALTCFSHLVLSLSQLRCTREAKAVVAFFRRTAKAEAGGGDHWAAQGWKATHSVIKRHESLQHSREG